MSEEFNYNTMLSTIADELENGSSSLEDIQMNTTSNDLWIIGTYKASQALEEFSEEDQLYASTNLNGVFGAIEYVKNYETEQFGTVNTDLIDPEKVANMVAYINIECVLNDLSDEFDIDIEEELTDQQADSIVNYINDQLGFK
jgi:hypothetical protein